MGACRIAHNENPNLEKMQDIRMLEISVKLDWGEIEEVEGQGEHNPLDDAMRTLDTAPHPVEHLVLNVNIWNPDELSPSYGICGVAAPRGPLVVGRPRDAPAKGCPKNSTDLT
jgi:hypothetical protein